MTAPSEASISTFELVFEWDTEPKMGRGVAAVRFHGTVTNLLDVMTAAEAQGFRVASMTRGDAMSAAKAIDYVRNDLRLAAFVQQPSPLRKKATDEENAS